MLSVFRIVRRNEAYRGSFGLSNCQNYQSASLRTLIVVAGVFRPGKYRLASKEHNTAEKTWLVSGPELIVGLPDLENRFR